MTILEEIEKAASGLSSEEIAKFRNWFDEFDARLWDKQLEQDTASGKLDDLARQAQEDHKAGRTRRL